MNPSHWLLSTEQQRNTKKKTKATKATCAVHNKVQAKICIRSLFSRNVIRILCCLAAAHGSTELDRRVRECITKYA